MIRPAIIEDLDEIALGYKKHFAHERTHGAFTIFQEGIYPTRGTAEKAIRDGALFVYEEHGKIGGSIIVDRHQPDEYAKVCWKSCAPDDRIFVIHLLMVHPDCAGKGIGSALVSHVVSFAKKQSCTAVRLDTGAQNIPAVSLYTKLGFRLAGTADMKVGGMLPHAGHLFFEKMV